jgi:hypothetical protein
MLPFQIEIHAPEPYTFRRCFGFNGGDHLAQLAATITSLSI